MKLATRIFERKRGTGANEYYVTSNFGYRKDPKTSKVVYHNGTDYGTHGKKWSQYALEDGIVESVWTDSYGAKCIRIRYDRLGYRCTHGHLDSIKVKTGDKVTHKTVVGTTGKTGRATGVHLHLGVQKIGSSTWIDPESINYEEPKPSKDNYKCLGNMYVRYGAGLNYGIKRVKELTEDGRKHCTTPDRPSADAIYKSGTIFTALEVINTSKYGLWAKSPSGYICIKGKSGREYCIKC